MNTVVENLTGMNVMTDQVIATDLLFAAKSGIRNYAVAITETASPEVRATLRKHLEDGIAYHEKVTNYMVEKGWYHPYNPQQQLDLVLKSADTALHVSRQ
ncbi:spore coat protein [Brevibacillus humidisoli]|uniref:spore coat protein n=1 Tax=Brevibacillus humidisoli TaxID=2895522 RepID=UPI001E618DD8|nr:spore coat protein [Brevibacillus humidisoli]UFJ42021.1 spore coat protein [Brevibacillus humidisoli]